MDKPELLLTDYEIVQMVRSGSYDLVRDENSLKRAIATYSEAIESAKSLRHKTRGEHRYSLTMCELISLTYGVDVGQVAHDLRRAKFTPKGKPCV